MQCENHREREAAAICVSCGKPLCRECDSMIQGKHYCKECGTEDANKTSQEKNVQEKRDINGFLWFIFSLIPGAGHMYMGLMRRGVMLLGAFLGILALNNLIFAWWDIVGMISVLVYVYAFFDSLSTKKALERGEFIEDEGINQFSIQRINLYYVGIIAIVIGVLSLVENNIRFLQIAPYIWEIIYGIQRSIVPVLLIIAGVWLMKRSKKNK